MISNPDKPDAENTVSPRILILGQEKKLIKKQLPERGRSWGQYIPPSLFPDLDEERAVGLAETFKTGK